MPRNLLAIAFTLLLRTCSLSAGLPGGGIPNALAAPQAISTRLSPRAPAQQGRDPVNYLSAATGPVNDIEDDWLPQFFNESLAHCNITLSSAPERMERDCSYLQLFTRRNSKLCVRLGLRRHANVRRMLWTILWAVQPFYLEPSPEIFSHKVYLGQYDFIPTMTRWLRQPAYRIEAWMKRPLRPQADVTFEILTVEWESPTVARQQRIHRVPLFGNLPGFNTSKRELFATISPRASVQQFFDRLSHSVMYPGDQQNNSTPIQ